MMSKWIELTELHIDPNFLDVVLGITYKRADLTRWEKTKIYFGFMEEPQRVRVEPKMLCDLVPRVRMTTSYLKKTNGGENNG